MPPTPSKEDLPVQWVPDKIIQQLFNDGQYQERLEKGEFRAVLISSRAPRKLPKNEPPGTLSQMVVYLDRRGRAVAMVHRYLRPDGMIGASGKPDPKALFFADHVVKVDPKHKGKSGREH